MIVKIFYFPCGEMILFSIPVTWMFISVRSVIISRRIRKFRLKHWKEKGICFFGNNSKGYLSKYEMLFLRSWNCFTFFWFNISKITPYSVHYITRKFHIPDLDLYHPLQELKDPIIINLKYRWHEKLQIYLFVHFCYFLKFYKLW